ncbi:MAG: hypothetical protein K6C14_07035 [Eubacterium sp.]|nr:hypothetical protein [Eubacterium sp.]
MLYLNSLSGFLLSNALIVLLSVIAYLLKTKVNDSRLLRIITGVMCLILTVQTVLTYITFSSDAVHPDFSKALLVVLISASVIYAVSLRLEPIARISGAVAGILVLAVLIAVLTNTGIYSFANLKAASFDGDFNLCQALKCLDLPLIYLTLNERTGGKTDKALFGSIISAYAVSSFLLVFLYLSEGTAFNGYYYPVFELFQLSKIGSFSRLDIIFTGSVLLALFLKCSVLFYCGLYGITGGKYEKNSFNGCNFNRND